MFGAGHFIFCINSSIATKVDSTYLGYSVRIETAHNVHVFATGGRKPVELRLLVRRLHDIAIQEDITCCHHQLWIKISLVANSVWNKR